MDGTPATTDQGLLTVATAAIDARDVPADGLFMAVPGTRDHGARFATQSAGRSVLTDEEGLGVLAAGPWKGTVLVVDDCRRWLGPVAAEIHGHPSRDMTVIGVTGTSGKTTTTYMMERALLGHRHVGLIGTTGTRIDGRRIPTSLTTPEAPTLQALFARMRDEGVTHVVMEVSSHALVLGRVRGVDVDVAGFTNLSQDHLDFHPTMEDYFNAKSLLFTEAQDPAGDLPVPVVCVDDDWGRRLATRTGGATVTVATAGEQATWQVTDVAVRSDGTQHVTVATPSGPVEFDLSVPGAFNVANATIALATLVAAGEDVAIAGRFGGVRVPGRMERISGTSPETTVDFLALVDYAHKPGAVTAVLDTLNGQLDRAASATSGRPRGRLGIVLGAGGNRDHEKRPKMGAAAAAAADLVIVTDDNPRDEDPATIRAAVLAGAHDAAARRSDGRTPTIHEIGDRAEAIRAAVAWAGPGDVVVVAGKGHESGQIIGDTVIDFDDRVELGAALTELKESEA
ncbi:UDP-N-acetylmuramoyl-L-alanyl-D-glutamate--2,6-diaminopimelate ligase [uncultured Corynebacterium sp.]|uniref:UDP-N-acetylmuramoyl-L-alanyl-D-glutamate--2, 6-diaminopimelate ligase n=1 Tax=uncultured Corynebacterium sp. TaxID=159447 RepID=UPI0025E369BD|nr:UDP-N-acetylmuramoyl-L-alanyl-D-glutamate--2,6-diaminopimelate ligase [uncultured Corynebacterium sp.]